jgi:hypothetical protein
MADILSVLALTMSIEGERVCACCNNSLHTVIYKIICLKKKTSAVSVNLELRHLIVAGEPEIPFVGL